MEKRAARLISELIKSGKIVAHDFVLYGNWEETEQELAKILQQASGLGKQYGYAMIEHQERAISAKDVAIGTALYLFLKRAKDIVSGIVGRVRDVVAQTIDDGGSVEDAQSAVDELLDSLPETVATTEIHTEVEQAVADVFEEKGVEMVECVCSPGACENCLANEEEGPIERDTAFETGDTLPPFHFRCRCIMVPSLAVTGS